MEHSQGSWVSSFVLRVSLDEASATSRDLDSPSDVLGHAIARRVASLQGAVLPRRAVGITRERWIQIFKSSVRRHFSIRCPVLVIDSRRLGQVEPGAGDLASGT